MEYNRENPEPRKRRSSATKARQMSTEQLMATLKKKKECNTRAQKIVEELVDSTCESEEFILKLKDINQSHYDDIVEERSITKICGYPLCNGPLKNIPAKQFQISTINNKVYDLTDRKKFCCNNCFKASQYIKQQMLTSPLWLRDNEIIPEFKLLIINKDLEK